ncbi:SpoIIE family protein phosphatase [Fluviicola taffensis]|uniref:Protein serine/threonine phosphatase n=1 Tax=Fluviicola taffensis (strain DSM 16823 / NCIMB 13979 / RW262) TaxID=755732 RepID=F2IEP5_FLUTR|nr:SpoIIE family protein phosphatase [Fluviicola taffensis]AEA45612.1 protein serine/threonine phosphatase [Fluviicola taffensis DSM 16823]
MLKNKGILLLILFTVHLAVFSTAQNITLQGRINTKHFSINEFGSAGQIWTGLQSANGDVLFGNRQDILSFNGIEWSKIKTDSEKTKKPIQENCTDTYVSKLYLASDDRVYVGRDNNFGYLDYSSKGELVYYPVFYGGTKNNIGQVWNIFELGDNSILFVAEKGLYVFKNGSYKKIEVPVAFNELECKTSCRILNGVLLTYQSKAEFKSRKEDYLYYDVVNSKLKELDLPLSIHIKNIRGSFQIDNIWYITDAKSKIFSVKNTAGNIQKWDSVPPSKFPCLSKYFVNTVAKSGNYLLVSTENNGLIIGDLSGKIIREYNLEDDLANLTVNHSFFDNDFNLWLCLGNGIQFIETGSPLSYFHKNEGVTSQIETIDFNSGIPLIGTHNGVISPQKSEFSTKLVPFGTMDEIIFDIETIKTRAGNKSMIIGYNGIFDLNTASSKHVSASYQYAIAFEKDPKDPNSIYLTLEAGLAKLKLLSTGKWEYEELVKDAGGETVSLAYLDNKIFFSIRTKGIGIYDLNTRKFKTITIPSLSKEDQNNNFYVEEFKGQVFVGTANGMFVYDERSGKIVPFEPAKAFKVKNYKNTIHRIINVNNEQLWVVVYQDKKDGKFENISGWFDKRGAKWEWKVWPLTGLKNAGLVFAAEKNPSANEVWIGANDGLFILNLDAIRKNRNSFKVQIDRLEVNGKSFLYNVAKSKKLEGLSYSQNSFKLFFHPNSFSCLGATNFSYKLEGFSDQWSQWSPLNFANFEKIPEGNYTFKVKAKSAYGIESEVLTYEIVVLPPWYRTVWAYVFYVILLIFLIYLVVQLSTQRVKSQNLKLEGIVQERTKEIAEQNHQLEIQKEEITAKTMDILDSIHYAKRIQSTILPTHTRLNELFKQHFVFYRPKDIVSGDFYWAREVQGKVIFSAVDCTGHGVPGALVSIVGNNGLLRAINEFKLTEPSEILDKLREIVINAFRAEGQADVKDGMDIALCSIDQKTGVLKFSGANNECVIIRNGEIIELKPNKQPIGQFIDAKPFHQQEYQLEHNDCVYLYTDGYVDQFGGDRLKKFKSRPFKVLLSTIYHLSMEEQYTEIQQNFDTWKHDVDQVDDVCVFAVKYIKTSHES